MGVDVHIEHIIDTEANIRANMDLAQIGILTDHNEEFVWMNFDKSKMYYGAAQKYWNGAAIVYMDVDFKKITAHGDIIVNEYIKRANGEDDYLRFEDNTLSIALTGTTVATFQNNAIQFNTDVIITQNLGIAADTDLIQLTGVNTMKVNGTLTCEGFTTTKGDASALIILSGAVDKWASLSFGRTVEEAFWGVSDANNLFFTGSIAGDMAMRVNSTSNKLLLGIGVGGTPELTIIDGKVGINNIAPVAAFDVRGANAAPVLISSGASNKWTALSIGRTAIEVYFGVAAGNNQFFTGVTAGDTMFRLSDTGHKIHFGIGTGGLAELVVSDGAVDINGNLKIINGRLSSGTLTLSAAGPTDNLDVSGVNTVFIDTSSNNVILGGTVGGVDGQVLHIVVHDSTRNTTIEDRKGTGNQDFYLHVEADETLTAEPGGWTFVNHGGGHWEDASHAKHV